MRTEGMSGERSMSLVPASMSSSTLIDQRFPAFAFGSSLVGCHFPQTGFPRNAKDMRTISYHRMGGASHLPHQVLLDATRSQTPAHFLNPSNCSLTSPSSLPSPSITLPPSTSCSPNAITSLSNVFPVP